MNAITDNQQKYENYREQMSRLTKAMKAEFYLEAIFIEYAVMEDRLESVLRHSGKWNPETDKQTFIAKKCKRVLKMCEEKKGLIRKYFMTDRIQDILTWVDSRNRLIHALLKQSLCTEDLKTLAEEGRELVKYLNSKSTSYNRALEKSKH